MPLICGLRFGVEGSVVGLPVFDRRDVAQRGVELAIVVSVDPARGGVLGVGQDRLGVVAEDGGADALGLDGDR